MTDIDHQHLTGCGNCPAHSSDPLAAAVRGNRRNLGYDPQPCTCPPLPPHTGLTEDEQWVLADWWDAGWVGVHSVEAQMALETAVERILSARRLEWEATRLAPLHALADEWEREFADRLVRSNATPKLTYRAAIDRLRAACSTVFANGVNAGPDVSPSGTDAVPDEAKGVPAPCSVGASPDRHDAALAVDNTHNPTEDACSEVCGGRDPAYRGVCAMPKGHPGGCFGDPEVDA